MGIYYGQEIFGIRILKIKAAIADGDGDDELIEPIVVCSELFDKLTLEHVENVAEIIKDNPNEFLIYTWKSCTSTHFGEHTYFDWVKTTMNTIKMALSL